MIYYDFGKDCNIQTKEFSCYLKDKLQIMLLYRKAHYDLAYTSDYYNTYNNYMDIFTLTENNLKVVTESYIFSYDKKIEDVDVTQSKIYDKKKKLNSKKVEQIKLNKIVEKISCIVCQEEILVSNDIVKLSCGCTICGKKECLLSLPIDDLFKNENISVIIFENKGMNCNKCKKQLYLIDLMNISNILSTKYQIDEPKTSLVQFITFNQLFLKHCMSCKDKIKPECISNAYKLTDTTLKSSLNVKNVIHLKCDKCKTDDLNCKLCGVNHK
jgi:hypothetical protein